MPILVQCPNPACRANCSVAEAVSGPVKCPKCGKPFAVKQKTFDGQKSDTKKSQPSSNANPFPSLPAEFGRYRVLRLLGQGGMGAVYLAEDSQLGRQVALKMPFLNASESSQRIERFVREARSAAALHHPNICTVFDAGQIDGRPFITMAYIAGTPLDEEIDPDVPMPQRRAAEIVRKVALALEHAHHKGTVHRDLKPANVMLAADGEPVVMDFGLAKRVETNGTNLTRLGGIVGTPSYMSPEQVNGEGQAIGPATDIYSLGVMLFEMLTGNTPYTGTTTVVMGQILSAPVPPVKEFRPDVDPQLDAICRKAMAKAPADRFPSMAEFASALGQFLQAPSSPPPLPAAPARSVRKSPSLVEDRSGHTAPAEPSRSQETATPGKSRSVAIKPSLPDAPTPAVAIAPAEAEASPFAEMVDSETISPPKRAQRKPQPLSGKAKVWIGGAIVLALLGGLTALWTVGGLQVKTRHGTIVLENLPADVEVFVDGEKVVLRQAGEHELIEITVVPGIKHKLEIKRGGLKLQTEEMALAVGERKPITVRVIAMAEPAKPPLQPPGQRPVEAVKPLDPADLAKPPLQPDKGNWIPLFNGKDLTGWKTHPSQPGDWRVENGILLGSGPKTSHLYTDRNDYKNFHLRIEAQVNNGGNSGIYFRAPFGPTFPVNNPTWLVGYNVKLDARRLGGLLVGESASMIRERESDAMLGEWLTLEVIAEGNRVLVKINDKTTVDYTDPQRTHVSGHIVLQQHTGNTVAKFRKIEIKELGPTKTGSLPPGQPDPAPIKPGLDAKASLDPDRIAAEYVLSVGGIVKVNDESREIRAVVELPKEAFRLTWVSLEPAQVPVDDRALNAFKGCKNLTHLHLRSQLVGDAGLVNFKDCKQLKMLLLYYTKVTDEGLATFAGCKDLEILCLNNCSRIGDAGMSHFKDRNLIKLEVSKANITDVGLAYFKDCKNLYELRLPGTQITDVGLGYFKGCSLVGVDLGGCKKVSDVGLAHLNFKNAVWVSLGGIQMSDKGLDCFRNSGKLTNLGVSNTKVTEKGVEELKKALPKCRINR